MSLARKKISVKRMNSISTKVSLTQMSNTRSLKRKEYINNINSVSVCVLTSDLV